MRALEFSGTHYPALFRATSLRAPSTNEFHVTDAIMTTDDSSQPDFHVKSRSVRIYPDSRVILLNSTLYVGQTPVSGSRTFSPIRTIPASSFLPGYDSRWGAFVQSAYSFPSAPTTASSPRPTSICVRNFGPPAVGGDLLFRYGKNDRSFGELLTYYVDDTKEVKTVSAPGDLLRLARRTATA